VEGGKRGGPRKSLNKRPRSATRLEGDKEQKTATVFWGETRQLISGLELAKNDTHEALNQEPGGPVVVEKSAPAGGQGKKKKRQEKGKANHSKLNVRRWNRKPEFPIIEKNKGEPSPVTKRSSATSSRKR